MAASFALVFAAGFVAGAKWQTPVRAQGFSVTMDCGGGALGGAGNHSGVPQDVRSAIRSVGKRAGLRRDVEGTYRAVLERALIFRRRDHPRRIAVEYDSPRAARVNRDIDSVTSR